MGMFLTVRTKVAPKADLSIGVTAIGDSNAVTRRLLRVIVEKDGSIYLTAMTAAPATWNVGSGPWDTAALGRTPPLGGMTIVGVTNEQKISFHASGRIRLGPRYSFRPPLRTIPRVENLCVIHYGDPATLPAISMEEFNAWQKTKGHLLFPVMLLPGHTVATKVFVAPPLGKGGYQEFVCRDFDLLQENVILAVHELPPTFPARPDGGHGYDVIFATGQWAGSQWPGPLVLIPATGASDDPEAARPRPS